MSSYQICLSAAEVSDPQIKEMLAKIEERRNNLKYSKTRFLLDTLLSSDFALEWATKQINSVIGKEISPMTVRSILMLIRYNIPGKPNDEMFSGFLRNFMKAETESTSSTTPAASTTTSGPTNDFIFNLYRSMRAASTPAAASTSSSQTKRPRTGPSFSPACEESSTGISKTAADRLESIRKLQSEIKDACGKAAEPSTPPAPATPPAPTAAPVPPPMPDIFGMLGGMLNVALGPGGILNQPPKLD